MLGHCDDVYALPMTCRLNAPPSARPYTMEQALNWLSQVGMLFSLGLPTCFHWACLVSADA